MTPGLSTILQHQEELNDVEESKEESIPSALPIDANANVAVEDQTPHDIYSNELSNEPVKN